MGKGFSLWELMVVITLVITLFVVAMENLLPLRGEAERATVAMTTGALRSAVAVEATRRIVQEGVSSVEGMRAGNPVEWLAKPMSNFSGETHSDEYHQVMPGYWSFDPQNGILFYRVRYPQYYDGNFTSPAGIRFKVELSRNESGKTNGVNLLQMDSAEWSTEGSELLRQMNEAQ